MREQGSMKKPEGTSIPRPSLMILLICGMFVCQTAKAEQFCLASVPTTAHKDQFEEYDTGIAWHKRTNLMWMRCSLGQTWEDGECIGEATKMTWQAALQTSVGYDFLNNKQWRLPNLKELASITEKSCVRPSIDVDIFPNTPPDDYWTSTPSIQDELRTWVIAFFNSSSSIKQKDRSLHVRLVRTALPEERIE